MGLLEAANGHALTLFTSYAALSAVKELLVKKDLHWTLYAAGGNVEYAARRFRNDQGKIDWILVKSISRFARNTRDCPVVLRELSGLGVYVYFEKENIGTDALTTEFMVSVYSSLAQEESVSISQNQRMSYQRRMEKGEFITNCAPPGYRMDGKKNLAVVEEEAEIVRWIYESYLNGRSTKWIADELIRRGVPTATGTGNWRAESVHRILTNEKYIGDALLQKTHVTDCITKKVRKNNGGRPMYYVENHHAAIIPKEVYRRVQEEMGRRSSKRKVMQKTAQTKKGKYSGKYAFSELLVCGECGSPYKRCTWVKKGRNRIRVRIRDSAVGIETRLPAQ